LLAPIDRLVNGLTDTARRDRTAVGVIAAYVVIWTLYGILAQGGQNVHSDSAQWVVLSRELSLGYWAHPPFCAWLVMAWFAVFPVADWAYTLLCLVLAGFTLLAGWHLFGRFLNAEKRVIALALLTFIPFFNFHILKYDHDQVLMPVAAATTFWMFRSFETRSIGFAALAGAGAAVAMLTKYWAIFLLVGLAVAAVSDPRRRAYFRSAAPWVTVAVGAVLLAPHVYWLLANDFPPFVYAGTDHKAVSLADAAFHASVYLAGAAGYVAAPLFVVLAAARPNLAAVVDMLRPSDPDRRFAATVFWVSILLPVLVALATRQQLGAMWVMSGLILFPVVLLSSPLLTISRLAVRYIVAGAVALPLVMAVLSPAIAIAIHYAGNLPAKKLYGQQLAERVEREWKQTTDKPLRLVGGDFNQSWLLAFYLPQRPSAFPALNRHFAPWVDDARLAREGVALAYDLEDESASGRGIWVDKSVEEEIASMEAHSAFSRRIEVELTKTYFGIAARPVRYLIVIVPPRD
jgi:hypothetical protein